MTYGGVREPGRVDLPPFSGPVRIPVSRCQVAGYPYVYLRIKHALIGLYHIPKVSLTSDRD